METISFGGRPVQGFALGASGGVSSPGASPAFAAVMAGATAGLLVYTFKGPLWGSILAGSGVAFVTKWGIDRSAEGA
jgi:hypothetical protein